MCRGCFDRCTLNCITGQLHDVIFSPREHRLSLLINPRGSWHDLVYYNPLLKNWACHGLSCFTERGSSTNLHASLFHLFPLCPNPSPVPVKTAGPLSVCNCGKMQNASSASADLASIQSSLITFLQVEGGKGSTITAAFGHLAESRPNWTTVVRDNNRTIIASEKVSEKGPELYHSDSHRRFNLLHSTSAAPGVCCEINSGHSQHLARLAFEFLSKHLLHEIWFNCTVKVGSNQWSSSNVMLNSGFRSPPDKDYSLSTSQGVTEERSQGCKTAEQVNKYQSIGMWWGWVS